MSGDNEELVASFVTETNEHLADMENELLAMEEAGADIDLDLVNTVFRGIHSTKGTAGFLGLKSIGSLAHEAENVLNLIRNRELVPTSVIVDVLLRSVDRLRSMVNEVESSNDVDVSDLTKDLVAVATKEASPETQEILDREIDIALPSGDLAFVMVNETELVSRQRQGCHIYVLKVDLIADVQAKDLNPIQFLNRLYELGELITSHTSTIGIGSLGDELPDKLVLVMLVGSKSQPDELAERLQVPRDQVHHIASPQETGWGKPEPAAAPAAAVSVEPTPASPGPTAEQTSQSQTPVSRETAKPAPTATRKETSLRVHVDVLDKLMNLAGELVLARNQLVQVVGSKDRGELESVSARLDLVTSELQETIMQTRMQAIGTVFNRFTRIVRDLSGQLGKQCTLTIEGKDVELDKTIIEAIGDPLTHLVRNSVDHGVESPEVRSAKGKKPGGAIALRAAHQGGKVSISISDDGAGIDAEKLKKSAVDKGVITADEARDMSHRDALRLIFHPGFSMAAKVTDVSGRGVGMDVVKTNIEKLGGTVEVDTQIDVGTTINIKLPLTLAIVPSLIVRAGDDRFAIPQVGISELVRVKASEVHTRIERVKDAEVMRLRGKLLPLIRLSDALDVESKYLDSVQSTLFDNRRKRLADRRDTTPEEPSSDEHHRNESDRRHDGSPGALNIIVVETGDLRYGIVVDALHDSEEIVVKPLGRHMKDCSCLAGATVLGDGAVALILDVGGMAAHKQLSTSQSSAIAEKEESATDSEFETHSVLLFTNSPTEQFGVPMDLISRIERIGCDQLDSIGGREVLQYRGSTLPILSAEDIINAKPRPSDMDKLNVIVFKVAGRETGLIAAKLVDIGEVTCDLDTVTFREQGILGSAIVDGVTTRLIDLSQLAARAHPEWFTDDIVEESHNGQAPCILLAEDSGFFRTQVTSFLESAGYKVVACEDGLEAWNTLQDPSQHFALVVTDIEMPNMNGLELTSKIKGDPCFAHLPVIAVTSLAGEEDVRRGREVGVNEYHIKMDRETLLEAVARNIKATQLKADTSVQPSTANAGRTP